MYALPLDVMYGNLPVWSEYAIFFSSNGTSVASTLCVCVGGLESGVGEKNSSCGNAWMVFLVDWRFFRSWLMWPLTVAVGSWRYFIGPMDVHGK